MVKNREAVFEQAEEMAAKYKEKLQEQGAPIASMEVMATVEPD
jgi:predicted RNase H-like HicB family nuclease